MSSTLGLEMPVIYVRGGFSGHWLNLDLGAKAREIQHPCRPWHAVLTACGVSYFVIMGLMARIRVDRRGRALASEAPSGEKSLSLNFSRQGCQYRIRDRTISGCEAYSYTDYVHDSSWKSSLEFNSPKRTQEFHPFECGGWESFKYKRNRNACQESWYPNGLATLSNLDESSY